MYKVFVDGQEGTTGLQIHDRLVGHGGVELIEIDPAKRKDVAERKRLLNAADLAFLCLPDAAAKESAALAAGARTRLIDASTAHRTDPAWVYGLPELNKAQREMIRDASRVANVGCHAAGFILLMHPLVSSGMLPKDYPVACHSLTGYSGGGKKMIAEYEAPGRMRFPIGAPRHYALGMSHKHLPEMKQYGGLDHAPAFNPIVGDFYKGMAVAVPLMRRLLPRKPSMKDMHELLAGYYAGERFVKVMPLTVDGNAEGGYFDPMGANDTNRNDIFVFGNDENMVLMSRLDNLGKGASGNAVQNMNLMLGLDEGTALG
ncbi:MAG TPA: N-acetyl-gamma-glutamyl-phosphate reductase [Burkholderiales bacterium]|nr:N-acetyl-gamma-glutamyl-phosphate reductase [Burkholderiales bacterium]